MRVEAEEGHASKTRCQRDADAPGSDLGLEQATPLESRALLAGLKLIQQELYQG